MVKKRKRPPAEFKAKVALEALQGVKSLSELSSQYGVHSVVIGQWKKKLVTGAPEIFLNGSQLGKTEEEVTKPLYEEIGRLKMELDWFKKKL